MNVRPVLVLALAGTLVTGACAVTDPAAAPNPASASAAPDPKDLLAASVPGEKTGPVAFAVTGGDAVTGILDASRKRIQLDVVQKLTEEHITITMNFLLADTRSWLKMAFTGSGAKALPAVPKKWMLIDPAKMTKDSDFPTGFDGDDEPGNAAAIIDTATGVKQVSPGHFTGTTDISGTGDGDIVDADTLKALGDQARSLPFEAATDAQGRLTTLVVEIPAAGTAKAMRYQVKYSGYGTTASPAEPTAAQQQKMPPVVYEILKG